MNESAPQPNWIKIFPNADHRWRMGISRGNAAEFFAKRDTTGDILAERRRWLREAPEKYAALTPLAEPALRDTLEFVQPLGVSVPGNAWEQMLAVAGELEPDFVWIHPDDAGVHRLTGGVVCFPSSWSLPEKIGKTMRETHQPVPGLNEALDRQIEKFFAKMNPGDAWTRDNIGYTRVPDLNLHPSRTRPVIDHSATIEELWLRLEHQLLLKLQPSGSILFGIRVDVFPLAEFLADPEIATRVARELATMSPEAAAYKSLQHGRETILQLLRSHLARKSAP